MEKPILVIMAAGMGSRYGGLKQIDPIDQEGHIIMDFSLFDARRAGFETVVFVIKKENEEIFKEVIGKRLENIMNVHYAFQELNCLPDGYHVPQGRVKPWGTAHAIYCCQQWIHGPFAVINADDYYGPESFQMIYDYLSSHQDDDLYRMAMVGYLIENTLTDNGTVARGVCEIDDQGYLQEITERTKIQETSAGIVYQDNSQWYPLAKGTTVSMNLWGFSQGVMDEFIKGFPHFLDEHLKSNPLKCEYFIPSVVSSLLHQKKATVKVLKTSSQWYGVTYKEDKPLVEKAIEQMKEQGIYTTHLWGDLDG